MQESMEGALSWCVCCRKPGSMRSCGRVPQQGSNQRPCIRAGNGVQSAAVLLPGEVTGPLVYPPDALQWHGIPQQLTPASTPTVEQILGPWC